MNTYYLYIDNNASMSLLLLMLWWVLPSHGFMSWRIFFCKHNLTHIKIYYQYITFNVGKTYSFTVAVIVVVGAAFTRFQTLRLQKIFPTVLADQLISYGSCQFPTLGFVVERYKQVQAFVPEPFWKLRGWLVSSKHFDADIWAKLWSYKTVFIYKKVHSIKFYLLKHSGDPFWGSSPQKKNDGPVI